MSYVFMKVLESTPSRYDRGIKLITLGGIGRAYDRIMSRIEDGWNVLDIGCGTGALTLQAAERGARVVGIDVNAGMLEIAWDRLDWAGLLDRIELREQGVAELSSHPAQQYDAATAGLVFSELSNDERLYTLRQVRRLLKPDGLLLITDETVPQGFLKAVLFWLVRIPLMIITYLLTQTTTHAIADLPGQVDRAGFIIEDIVSSRLGSLTTLVARNAAIAEEDR